MRGEVLDVQQLQRDAGPPQLLVQRREVRLRPGAVDLGRRRAIQPALERVVAQRLDRLPGQGRRAGAAHRRRHRAGAHAQAPRRLPVAALGHPLQAQDLSNLLHRHALRRHSLPVSPMGQRSES